MKITDSVSVAGMRLTDSGYLEANARTARTGVQKYRAGEIGLIGDEVVNVYRDEAQVFSKASLDTFSKLPITMGHPAEPVNSENWRDHAVGTTGDEVLRDGEYLKIGLKITDADAVKAVQEGRRELSVGYTADIQWGDGVAPDGTKYRARQVGIIANHIAIVDRARAGSRARIGDDADHWGAAPIITNEQKGSAMSDNLRTIMVDGLSIPVTDQGAQAITKLTDELAASRTEVVDAEKEVERLTKDCETKDGEIAALTKKLEDATSPAALSDMAKKRDKAMKAGKAAGMSEEDMEKMDDAAIRKAVVSKSLGDTAKDMTDAAIDGAFAALQASGTTTRKDAALGDGITTNDGGDPWAFLDKKGA